MIATVCIMVQPALAAPPPNPSDKQISAAQAAKNSANAAISAAAKKVAAIDAQIDKLEAQTEAAASKYQQAQGEVELATAKSEQAQVAAKQAAATVVTSEKGVQSLARNSYIQGSFALSGLSLLESSGPADLIDRSNMLDIVSNVQLKALSDLQKAQLARANTNAAAKKALMNKQAAEEAAESALTEVTNKLQDAKVVYAQLAQQKASLDQQLALAQSRLMKLENKRQTYQQYVAKEAAKKAAAQKAAQAKAAAAAAAAQQAAAAQAAANANSYNPQPAPSAPAPSAPAPSAPSSGAWALPAGGVLTSCFCPRWGTSHGGIDIAAPLGTPIYAAGSGVVLRSGPATGFGFAIYIQHPNGNVTVYGHMQALYVSAGQSVSAGQHIAAMGSQGFSTGSHLHFEVTLGIYGTRIDPAAWLAARGIYV